MKVHMAVLSASVILLASCASTGEKTSYMPQTQQQAHQTYPQTRIRNDEAYMARVEAIARRRGVDLTWVNPPPTKLVAKDE